MKKLIILLFFFSCKCFGQTKDTTEKAMITAMQKSNIEMRQLTIEGLKAIRHDCIVRLQFRRAKELKNEIDQLEKNKKIFYDTRS